MGVVKSTFEGAMSLIQGMGVTFKHLWRKPVTVQYPKERADVSEVHRNAIVLINKDELGSHGCIACQMCQKICPSVCITVEGSKREGIKTKRPDIFEVDFSLCSDCGLCLDVCPTDTLGYSTEYDLAGYHRDDFIFNLLEPHKDKEETTLQTLRDQEAKKQAERVAKRKADAEAKKKKEAEEAAKDSSTSPESKEKEESKESS
jgi:NADH-quinone oxidoreductase chain I